MHQLFSRSAITVMSTIGAGFAAMAACSSDPDDGSQIGGDNGLTYTPDSGPAIAGNNGFGSGVNLEGNGGAGAGTGLGGSGGICAGVGTAAEPLPVDMFIMLDQSSSMSEPLGMASSKWDATSSAIQAFVNSPRAAGIGVGIQYFGLPDSCNVNNYATPEVAMAQLPGNALPIQTSIQGHGPSTLTPTAPALQGALQYMQTWAVANPNRASVVVLATDGFPTECGVACATNDDCYSKQCVNGQCDPGTSIEEIALVAERYANADPPVLTFVVGVAQGLANLDRIARGGGTGEAYLIDGGNVEQEFLDAMLSISSTPLTCEFDFPTTDDPNNPVDKDKVSVIYTKASDQSQKPIVRVNGVSSCAVNLGEGWYYDYEADPTKILICPETCKSFRAGSVSIELGCTPPVSDIN